MNINKWLKSEIIIAYKKMAHDLYLAHLDIDRDTMRLYITQTIVEHALTQHAANLKTAKRVSKYKIKKLIKETEVAERVRNGYTPEPEELEF